MGDVIKIQDKEYKVKFTYRVLEEFCQAIEVPDISDATRAVMVAVGGFNLKVCAKLCWHGLKTEHNLTLDETYDLLEREPFALDNIIAPIAKIYFAKTSEMTYGKDSGELFSKSIMTVIDSEKEAAIERAKKKLQGKMKK